MHLATIISQRGGKNPVVILRDEGMSDQSKNILHASPSIIFFIMWGHI